MSALAGSLALSAFVSGCSAKRYRKSADQESYRIIQQVEQQVFGRTNSFTIDTSYSGRAPKTIPPSEIIADRNATNTLILDLNQALDLAVKHSREYQTQKEQLYLAALALTGARYEFTPQFFGEIPQAGIVGVSDGLDNGRGSVVGRSRWGVSQLLKTGGRLSLTLASDLVHYFGQQTPSHDSTLNVLSVDLVQPLLRGFGVNDPAVENLTQAERDTVYAIRSYSLYQQQFAVNTVNAYFDLLTRKDIVRNNFRNYTNRVETTSYLEARAVDRERRSSVDDARNAELNARSSYINSLASYLATLDSFKLRLGLPLSTSLYLDDRDLTELVQAGITRVDIDREVAFKMCVDKQMEILNAIDQFEDSKRKVRLAVDQLRPNLSLQAGGRMVSERNYLSTPADYTHFKPENFQYEVGLQVNNFPFDRLPARNAYRRELVLFERQLRSLGLVLDTYKDQIDRGLRLIEQNRLNYVIGQESLKVAERRLENNAMLLEAGRATIRDVREAQDSLIQAQNSLAIIYADYLAARLQLLLNIGVIDTKPEKFWLEDPLKQRLTPDQLSTPALRMPDDQVVPPEKFLEPEL